MSIRPFVVTLMLVGFASAAHAQDFGVLESAETINRGNIKLGVYPLFTLPEEGDTQSLVGATFGYGIANAFDLEGRAAFSSDVTFIGADGEYWAVKNRPLDLSLRGGVHFGFVDGEVGDTAAVDASVIASAPLASRLELIGALDMAFNWRDVGATRDAFTTVHLVPGVEVALTPRVDLLGEFGIGVTDESSHYVAFGVAFYLR